jgi:hypothetical protein
MSVFTKRERKYNDRLRADIQAYMSQFFPNADEVKPQRYAGWWYVEVWKDGVATIHNVPKEAVL